MKKKLWIGVMAAAAIMPVLALAKDPIVMTINGKDVKLSEFEYLYNKNKQQQLEKQPFDKYVDMFVTYKLKVADAEAAGIDTTKSFLKEFSGYRNDLASPYLDDKSTTDRLAKEAYDRMKEDVDVWQIMVPLSDPSRLGTFAQKAFLDSIRQCIVNKGEDFSALALKYSIDPSVKRNNGHIGYIRSGLTPYDFEYAAYNTPIGSVSEVVETPFGYHIVKPIAKRPSQGTVLVAHILKLFPKDATPKDIAKLKQQIDSIYGVVKGGANFEDVAKKESEDRGSKANGGKLPWFGTGQMIPEFEKVAFDLTKDSISTPFQTAYGFHIVKKLDSKGLPPFEDVKNEIIGNFVNDDRMDQGRREKLSQFKKQYNYTITEKGRKEIYDMIEKCNGYDSLFIANLNKSNTDLITFGNQSLKVKDLINKIKGYNNMNQIAAKGLVDRTIDPMGEEALIEYVKSDLAQTNPEFGNLIHEYRDGLLLFEISNRKVWDKASKDQEGLEAYFKANKNKYVWDSPKYKGFLIQVSNDSIAKLVKAELTNIGTDTLITTLKKQFKHNIKIEKVLVAKGENKLIDAVGFSRNVTFQNPDQKYPIYFTYEGEIIGVPEEANDVRGQVTVDYQNELEAAWIKELQSKYPVNINKKVLKKVK